MLCMFTFLFVPFVRFPFRVILFSDIYIGFHIHCGVHYIACAVVVAAAATSMNNFANRDLFCVV